MEQWALITASATPAIPVRIKLTPLIIGAGETAGGIPAEVAGSHQHLEGPNSLHVKIVIGDGCGLVMRRLGRRVDAAIGPHLPEEVAPTLAVTNIQGVVPMVGEGGE